MKNKITLFFLLLFFIGSSQNLTQKNRTKEYQNCNNKTCKIKKAFLNAEYYLEEDNLLFAQKWLEVTKNLNASKKNDSTSVFINSLQSELFYYNGLFQFGINEAEKVITTSMFLKDSLMISNGYFFKGINLFELNKLKESEKMLRKSRDFQPRTTIKKHIRSAILNEHIYNNLAHIKKSLHQSDSAIWYNSKAYQFAKKNNSKRGIPNIEQTFGILYIDNNE